MDSIVEHGLKIDLHIHSCASAPKDGSKVKNNTVENIPLLVSKLNENGVNICAITDHDTFSLEMYSELKKAELDTSSIKKVLPGVKSQFLSWIMKRGNKSFMLSQSSQIKRAIRFP